MKETTSDGEDYCLAPAESDLQKAVGVLIDNKLSLKVHISQAAAKANQILCIISVAL